MGIVKIQWEEKYICLHSGRVHELPKKNRDFQFFNKVYGATHFPELADQQIPLFVENLRY